MFGEINIKHIAKGFYNDLRKKEQDLHDKRMKICKDCPLVTYGNFGYVCDRDKEFKGIRGCGCFLDKKSRVPEAHCVLNKW